MTFEASTARKLRITTAELQDALDRIQAHQRRSGDKHLWTGTKDKDGYPVIRVGSRTSGDRRMVFVHDVLGEYHHGPGPGQWDHESHDPLDVNPAHLRRVTQQENLANRRRYRTSMPQWRTNVRG